MSKKRMAVAAKFTDNLLHLSFSSPRSYDVESYNTAIYCEEYDAIVLFVLAFRRERLTDELIDEITRIINHENLHKAIFHTFTEKERTLRFLRCEEDVVLELETV